MICYRCGSVIGAGKYCLHCGANISVYKRIVRISNAYYNAGLAKAGVRDLSGALDSLSRALEFDHKNIPARNLLGLVYYEMGEDVEALCQWVVSKNLQPDNNPAEEYIAAVQGNARELEEHNQAIRKFNQALDSAKHDGEDLAIIQLRKVISQHPHLLKAYQLLALLYIRGGDYSRAGKVLKRALQIDRGNVLCQEYAASIRGRLSRPRTRAEILAEQGGEIAAQEVISPEQKQRSGIWQFALGAVLTAAVCLGAYFFLLRPSSARELNNKVNQNQIAYNEKLGEKDSRIAKLEEERDSLQEDVDMYTALMENYTGENGSITNYNRLLVALQKYTEGSWYELMDVFKEINPDTVEMEEFQSCYKTLEEFVNSNDILEKILQEGVDAYNNSRYARTREVCAAVLELNPDYDKAIYYMAMAYEASGNDSAAAPYFQDIVNRFPGSQYYQQAKRRVS